MLEEDYIIQMSPMLRNFKKLKSSQYRFSCPVCGDSQKVRSKARGNLFLYKGSWVYHCYNCGTSLSFSNFLKRYFPDLYKDFVFDKFSYSRKARKSNVKPIIETKKPVFKTTVLSGDDVVQLDHTMSHKAVKYLLKRGMTNDMVDTLYYADNFKRYVNETLIPEKFEHIDDPDPRIIIPFYSMEGKIIGLQGRSLDPNNPVRYITIKLIADDEPLLYGLDTIDQSKDVFVLEGPIDSMFIDNSVAWAGGSLHKVNGVLNPILVWDNEPRNKDINKQIQKAIDMGHRIVIFPRRNKEKDINDMINAGIKVDNRYLRRNTYSGLNAQLQFDKWRK